MAEKKPNENYQTSPIAEVSSGSIFYRYSIVFILAIVLIIGSGFVLWRTNNQTIKINQLAALSDSRHIAHSVSEFRNFYAKTVVPKASKSGLKLSHDYIDKIDTLPLPATFIKDFGDSFVAGKSKLQIKLFSDKPFPWRSQTLDVFEKKALKTLGDSSKNETWSFENLNGMPVLRYARADVLKESCVACHNTYPGTPKTDWKVGDVRGVFEIIRPISEYNSSSVSVLKQSFLMMLGIILSMVLLLFFILRKLTGTIVDSLKVNKQLNKEILHRKKISHNLEASDMKMRAIVNSVADVIVVIDESGVIIECNNAINSMFGYSINEILGMNISLLMTGEHGLNHGGYIEKYIQTGTGDVMGAKRQFFAKRKNGESFPIDLLVNDARVDDEIIFTGTIRDITHRRKAEEAVAISHQAALDSAKLKSEFLANMSHEIRTPMNGVIGMTEMLLLSDLTSEQKDLVSIVKDSATSLLVIINDILDLSKIEAGKLTINKSRFYLMQLIEASIDLLRRDAEKKHIELAYFIDKDVPRHITTDPGRLRQVLLNLLNNALKFTEQGHVILHVSLDDEKYIHFAIIDSGMGITKENKALLFKMFSQIDGSSSREHRGTGLGLAISKQLVDLMGGKIGAKSKEKVGSTFWFTIAVEESIRNLNTTPFIQVNEKILMLNAFYSLNDYYKEQLMYWGLKPTIVSNQIHFLDKLAQTTYKLIAIDIDSFYFDSGDTTQFESFLTKIGKQDSIILYGQGGNIAILEDKVLLSDNIQLMRKPIKHTVIRSLFSKLFDQGNSKVKRKPIELPEPTFDAKSNKYHILLAEDNPVNQKVATIILEKFSCKVTVAANGLEALSHIKQEPFDAVFMDCQMPEMDGYDASRAIRKLPSLEVNQDIPIIAFTANAMSEDRDKCSEAGMDDYLTKPIDINELQIVLKRWEEKMNLRMEMRLNELEK